METNRPYSQKIVGALALGLKVDAGPAPNTTPEHGNKRRPNHHGSWIPWQNEQENSSCAYGADKKSSLATVLLLHYAGHPSQVTAGLARRPWDGLTESKWRPGPVTEAGGSTLTPVPGGQHLSPARTRPRQPGSAAPRAPEVSGTRVAGAGCPCAPACGCPNSGTTACPAARSNSTAHPAAPASSEARTRRSPRPSGVSSLTGGVSKEVCVAGGRARRRGVGFRGSEGR